VSKKWSGRDPRLSVTRVISLTPFYARIAI
jgi:hypothetical protein